VNAVFENKARLLWDERMAWLIDESESVMREPSSNLVGSTVEGRPDATDGFCCGNDGLLEDLHLISGRLLQ